MMESICYQPSIRHVADTGSCRSGAAGSQTILQVSFCSHQDAGIRCPFQESLSRTILVPSQSLAIGLSIFSCR